MKRATELPDAKRSQAELRGSKRRPSKMVFQPHECPYMAQQVQKVQEYCKIKHEWGKAQRPRRSELTRKITTQSRLRKKHEMPWREVYVISDFSHPDTPATGQTHFPTGLCAKRVAEFHNTRVLYIIFSFTRGNEEAIRRLCNFIE